MTLSSSHFCNLYAVLEGKNPQIYEISNNIQIINTMVMTRYMLTQIIFSSNSEVILLIKTFHNYYFDNSRERKFCLI